MDRKTIRAFDQYGHFERALGFVRDYGLPPGFSRDVNGLFAATRKLRNRILSSEPVLVPLRQCEFHQRNYGSTVDLLNRRGKLTSGQEASLVTRNNLAKSYHRAYAKGELTNVKEMDVLFGRYAALYAELEDALRKSLRRISRRSD